MNFIEKIGNHTLEYLDDDHIYLIDGVISPSITTIIKEVMGNKYSNVDYKVLKKAADKGTTVHNAIECYCKGIKFDDCKEVKNFAFLQKHYGFEVIENEKPVILFDGDVPVSAGRFDMMIRTKDGESAGADIKRTSALDKNYLVYQLNLYRVAYKQTYGEDWTKLYAFHLRDDVRKMVEIPINDDVVKEVIEKVRSYE